MTGLTDWELWACARQLIAQHGDYAATHAQRAAMRFWPMAIEPVTKRGWRASTGSISSAPSGTARSGTDAARHRAHRNRVCSSLTATAFAQAAGGGGRWQLDVRNDPAATRLADRRITVTGWRAAFDLLEVDGVTSF